MSSFMVKCKDKRTGHEEWVDYDELSKIGKVCSVCHKVLETEKDWDKHAKRHPGHFMFDGV